MRNEVGQFAQALSPLAETGERIKGLVVQFGSKIACAFQSEQADVGGFFGFSVLAGGFAQCGGAGGTVEDVVDDLEK